MPLDPSGAGGSAVPDAPRTGELWDLVKAGDAAAQEAFDRRFRPLLLCLARTDPRMRRLRKRCAEEDLVQDCLLKLHHSRDAFVNRGRGAMEAYLRKILDGCLVDRLRRMEASKRSTGQDTQSLHAGDSGAPDREESLAIPAPDPSATSQVRTLEIQEIARRVLTDREWRIWCLEMIEGLSSEDVGQRLGMPASTVRSIGQKITARLLRALGPSYGEEE
ncbi:MAG: sigma-70 family RNA polymerase sigma factor [Planctomycetota bacterium]